MSGASVAAAIAAATAAVLVGRKLAGGNANKDNAPQEPSDEPPVPELKPCVVPEGHEKVELSMADKLIFLNVGATSTVTFFKGDLGAAEQQLRSKFTEVVSANPWMAGNLVTDLGAPAVVAPTTVTDKTIDSLMEVDTKECNIHPNLALKELCTQVSKYEPPFGQAALDNKDVPLARLVLVPCRNEDGTLVDEETAPATFALIFFLAHIAGDGYTFYELLGMLSKDQPVRAMNFVRKENFDANLAEAMGGNPMIELHMRRATQWNEALTCRVGRPNKYFTLLMDQAAVEKTKAKVQAEAAKRGDKEAFVSTNDLITAYLGKAAKSRTLTMAVDCRKRVKGMSSNDAGNYVNVMHFDKGVYKQPTGIRKALQALERNASGDSSSEREDVKMRTRDHPTIARIWGTKKTVVTNWSSTCKELVIPGCQEVLHVRTLDLANYVPIIPYDLVTVFKARQGQLVLLVISRHLTEEKCLKAIPFLRKGALV